MRRAPEFSSLFIDFNSFFASVEQQHDPLLRGRPVIVAPLDSEFTGAIAVSYEARSFGIKMGMRIGEARQLCPGLAVRKARPQLYVEYHHRLMAEIERHAPIDTVHSIDEACCRLIGPDREPEAAADLARRIKAGIAGTVGPAIRCSIGISATPLLAKIASDLEKPNGLVLVRAVDVPARLAAWSLSDIAGIGAAMMVRLNRAGVHDIAGLWALQPKQARAIWGSVTGERFWYAINGYETAEPATQRDAIGHSRVLDPQWRHPDRARLVARELALKASQRMRRHGLCARRLALSVRLKDGDRRGGDGELPFTQDSFAILARLDAQWRNLHLGRRDLVKQASVTLIGLVPLADRPVDLFSVPGDRRREALWRAIDGLRGRRGLNLALASQRDVHLQDLGAKIAFTRIPELAEFTE